MGKRTFQAVVLSPQEGVVRSSGTGQHLSVSRVAWWRDVVTAFSSDAHAIGLFSHGFEQKSRSRNQRAVVATRVMRG
jgi:hypothetical protein